MAKSRKKRTIHIASVGSSAAAALERLGVASPTAMCRLIAEHLDHRYRISGATTIIKTTIDESRGGRCDDAARARDIQAALADDNVAALVTIRGGAWFVRVLPRIDFDVLKRRKTPLHLFGFSEMTPLINIAGACPKCIGLYDLGPAALFYGMERWAKQHITDLTRGFDIAASEHDGFAAGWAAAQYRDRFLEFFSDVAAVIQGRPSPRKPAGRLHAGTLPKRQTIQITGGNLALLVAMLGSPHAAAFDPAAKWLAIEDLGESPERIDRMLAALKLAGWFDRAAGLFIGDFHDGDHDLRQAVHAMLPHHLPPRRRIPLVDLDNLGHVWPIAPLPLHRPVTLTTTKPSRGPARVEIDIPWADFVR